MEVVDNTIISNENIRLREFQTMDAEELYNLNSDPNVLKHTGDDPFRNIIEAKNFLSSYKEYQLNGMGRWATIRKSDQAFLGWCGLKLNENGVIDLGFRFFKKFWGRGYATESSLLSLKYGFETLNLEMIIGRTSILNIGGQKVLENCGFKKINTIDYDNIGKSYYYELTQQAYKNQLL